MSVNHRQRTVAEPTLVALGLVVGIQSLRALSPQMSFLLRDRLHWPSEQIGAGALLLFAAGFLPLLIGRKIGFERLLLASAGAMALPRLGLQLWQGDPLADLVAHVTVAVGFFCFLPLTLARTLTDGRRLHLWILGFFAGQTLDLALFGGLGTYDLPWHQDFSAAALTTLLVATLLMACRSLASTIPGADLASPKRAWIALGPYLFLWFQLFGNPGRLGASFDGSHRGPWIAALCAGLGLVAVVARARPLSPVTAGIALAVTAGVATWAGRPFPIRASFLPGNLTAWAVAFFGSMSLGLCWLWTAQRLQPGEIPDDGEADGRLDRLAVAHGLGCLSLAVLTFAGSASFDVPLPFEVAWLYPAAVVALGLGMGAVRRHSPSSTGDASSVPGLVPTLALAVLVAVTASWPRALPTAQAGAWPVKVVSYNLHCAVGPRGGFDLEAMARTLEKADADVVALQEISRGWGTIAGLDMAEWLSRRLEMPFVFYGTGDMTWGNALLSRLPIETHAGHPLPSPGLLLKRGYIDARIRLENGPSLRILATHLHHPDHGGPERELQAAALLEAWNGTPRTVILGDLNAKPPSAEMESFRSAGLVDAFADQAQEAALSYPSVAPIKRIDYIWHSPDLAHSESIVSESTASDHRLIATVLTPVTGKAR